RAWCDWGGHRPYRPGCHHDLIHRPAFWAVNRIFVQIIEFSAATGAEPFGTQFGFRHGRLAFAICASKTRDLLFDRRKLACPSKGRRLAPAVSIKPRATDHPMTSRFAGRQPPPLTLF